MKRKGKEQAERKLQEGIHDHLSEEFIGEWVEGDHEDMRVRWSSSENGEMNDAAKSCRGEDCWDGNEDKGHSEIHYDTFCSNANCKNQYHHCRDYERKIQWVDVHNGLNESC